MESILTIFFIFIATATGNEANDVKTLVDIENLDELMGVMIVEKDMKGFASNLDYNFEFDDCGKTWNLEQFLADPNIMEMFWIRLEFTRMNVMFTSPETVTYLLDTINSRLFKVFVERKKGAWKFTRITAIDCQFNEMKY